MSQKLIQTQKQEQKQIQKLSQQQMLQVHLLEMPLTELEETVTAEMYDNPALESGNTVEVHNEDSNLEINSEDEEDYVSMTEKEERESALDEVLQSFGKDDVMPDLAFSESYHDADYEEIIYGSKDSFYDVLREQMNMRMLNDKEKTVMEYLIGSLDNDGLLRKEPDIIIDELAIYYDVTVTTAEMERMIHVLQEFDPAGIGARNLRECLLLQIKRKEKNDVAGLMYKVIDEHYDEFINKHWEKIWRQMNLGEEMSETVLGELLKLNPKPGASLGETEGSKMQQVTPDFIVDTSDEGEVTFTINSGRVPELYISQEYSDMVREYGTNKENMNRGQKEALLYARQKVERAQGFIDAVKQRRHTLYVTMKAIIDIQKKYFQDGDESDLRPMILKDIADKTGLDISTISRVSNMKYAQTRWGMFKLRHFFTNGYVTDGGTELPTRMIKIALKELVKEEDKKHPLSDKAICELMEKKGFTIARRTVAKYREQLSIPVARLRKK